MKKQIQREQALEKIAAHILKNGLAQTSVRQLAAAAEVSDRMLLYYFEDKTDLMTSALTKIVGELSAGLNERLDETPRPAARLFEDMSSLTQSAELRPYMRLWVEISAAASLGEAPYAVVADQIAAGFLAWIEARLDVGDPDKRRRTAAMLMTVADGLALLDPCQDGAISALARQAMLEELNRKA